MCPNSSCKNMFHYFCEIAVVRPEKCPDWHYRPNQVNECKYGLAWIYEHKCLLIDVMAEDISTILDKCSIAWTCTVASIFICQIKESAEFFVQGSWSLDSFIKKQPKVFFPMKCNFALAILFLDVGSKLADNRFCLLTSLSGIINNSCIFKVPELFGKCFKQLSRDAHCKEVTGLSSHLVVVPRDEERTQEK